MCGFTEYTPNEYIASKCSLREKIAAIDVIIMNNIALIGNAVSGSTAGTAMYELDDGQVRIKVSYDTTNSIIAANTALEKMQQMYINRLNGRTTVLRSKSTLRGGYGYGGYCGC
jgi:hypothetical protein